MFSGRLVLSRSDWNFSFFHIGPIKENAVWEFLLIPRFWEEGKLWLLKILWPRVTWNFPALVDSFGRRTGRRLFRNFPNPSYRITTVNLNLCGKVKAISMEVNDGVFTRWKTIDLSWSFWSSSYSTENEHFRFWALIPFCFNWPLHSMRGKIFRLFEKFGLSWNFGGPRFSTIKSF